MNCIFSLSTPLHSEDLFQMAAFPEPNAFLHVITNYDIAQVANLCNARTNKKGQRRILCVLGINLGQSDRYIFQLDNLEKRILSKACSL